MWGRKGKREWEKERGRRRGFGDVTYTMNFLD